MSPVISIASENGVRNNGVKRPILYILIPFALGIASSAIFKVWPVYAFSLSTLFLASSIIYSRKVPVSHISLYLALFFFGVFYLQNSVIFPGDHISRSVSDSSKTVFLQGMISDDPTVGMTPYHEVKTTFILNVDSVKEGETWRRSRGRVDVSLYGPVKKPLHFGQKIVMEGALSKPVGLKNPGLFDYEKYLAIKEIYAVFKVKEGGVVETVDDDAANRVKAAAYRLRNWIRTVVDKHFEAPYNGFIKAIMIGDRTDLRFNLNDDFIKTGTIHAIAISGLNVGLIAAIFMGVLALLRLPKKLNFVLVACAMVVYTFIAGASPPIVRAVIIFVVFVAGYLMNRESDMLNSLAFAAFIMLLANPRELFDPSFQLSFVSIAGMVIFMPAINNFLRIDAVKRHLFLKKTRLYLLSASSVSAGAWFSTWPIVAYYFNIISPVALVANLVVVPALFVLTAGSFLFLLAAPFSGFLSGSLAHALSVFCKALFTANHFLADLPFAYARIAAPSGAIMALYYTAIFLVVLPPKVEFKKISVRRIDILIFLLIAINALVWSEAVTMNGDVLKITFLDVGQGDSALVELPGGKNVLIDAGPGGDEERFDAARSVIAPYLWNRKINKLDAVIVTHFHEDHLGGVLYLLDNFKVMSVMDNGAYCERGEIFDKYISAIKNKKVSRKTIGDGDAINFKDGTIFVLNPEKGNALTDCNENSLVLKIHCKNFDAFFCGDASNSALARMTARYGDFLRSDIIKMPHHGGNVGSDIIVKNFLNATDAYAAIISVAKMNKYRMPSEKTLKILNALSTIIYETRDNGAIMVSADEDSYSIRPYIKSN